MALSPGTRLGPYEIVSALGAGGMGEVYRAHDTKLGRDVAIKSLPLSFAADPDRLARFEREARLLASLNHPNIGAIYGIEERAGMTALVLELIEGESKFNQYGAAISPDGHRVAFVSDDSGQAEVYLTLRNGVGKVLVSSAGGTEPVWSHNGRELFYRSGRRLMSVATATADSLDVGTSQLLFDGPYFLGGRDPSYAVSADGQRFLMRPVTNSAAGAEVVVTLNWLEELKTRMLPK